MTRPRPRRRPTRAAVAALVLALVGSAAACRNPGGNPGTTTTTTPGPTTTSPGGPTTTTPPGQAPPGPGSGAWTKVARANLAAECGLDPALMDAADRRIGQAYSVVRSGKLCWSSSGSTTPFAVWSVTKTWGGLMVGIVSARSSMRDTDLASKWLSASERSGLNANATVAHILAMTGTSRSLAAGAKNSFAYDTVGSRELNKLNALMTAVIQREPANFGGATNVYDFASRVVFPKLGMTSSRWPQGSAIAYGLNSTTEDLARMGLLILRKGNWNGEQLITEEYLYRMAHPSFPDSNTGLGYLLWLNNDRMAGPSGRSHGTCAPNAVWAADKQAPFPESKGDYGGTRFPNQRYDIGVAWAAGLGGQWSTVHRGVDLVITGHNVTGGGNWVLWDAVRPALVANDATYRGNEAGFCAAYLRGDYAPTLLSPWS